MIRPPIIKLAIIIIAEPEAPATSAREEKMPEPMEGDGFLNIPESMEEEMPFR